MDCFDTNGYWEEESHDSDSVNGSCLLRIVISLSCLGKYVHIASYISTM